MLENHWQEDKLQFSCERRCVMSKWRLFSSIFQITVGIAAIIAYIVIAASGEPLGKWTVTLLLAIAFVVIGVIGIADWKKSNRK